MEIVIEGKNICDVNREATETCSYDCSSYR